MSGSTEPRPKRPPFFAAPESITTNLPLRIFLTLFALGGVAALVAWHGSRGEWGLAALFWGVG